MKSQNTILVTGATGFIGSRLVPALIEKHGPGCVIAMAHTRRDSRGEAAFRRLKEHSGLTLLECDLLKLPQSSPPAPRCDVVYHLAAFAETETPSDEFRVNSEGTLNLLHWLGPKLDGARLVYTGTLASVDRDDARGPITEATPCTPKTPYGRTKLLGEEHVRSHRKQFGYDYTVLRLCTIMGPGYRPGGMFGECRRLLARQHWVARLNWPGRVSFLSLRDLIRILLAIPDNPRTANELFVLSNGENPTFDELLDQMARVLGCTRKRIQLPLWVWRLAAAIAWPIAGAQWVPWRLRNSCWRVTHVIRDGICADSAKLDNLFGKNYQTVLDALRETYEN